MSIYTNINNLPEGEYVTEHGYSQSYPYVVVKRTAKSITIAEVKVKSGDWSPEFVVGGFVANCTNQHEQKWEYDGINLAHQKTVRWSNRGWAKGTIKEGKAVYFYDYNF
jgi:hypothetical protein